MKEKKKLAVVIQCRLSSSRLPEKALKSIGGKTLFEWTLDSMKKIDADSYVVATDEDSFDKLEGIAKKHGWDIIKGPLDDVLERFCMVIKKVNCNVVLRATADNPFLFYEAAQSLVDEFYKQNKIAHCDYLTWKGLPHGSGVEIFYAESLLKAALITNESYDREHVGPALYNHKDKFTSLFLRAPSRFYYPDYRTTIDTPADYRRAISVVDKLSDGKAPSEPYTTEQIVSAIKDPEVHDTILYFPCTKKGCGTGHLRRCLYAAKESGAFVYIPNKPELKETDSLVQSALNNGLKEYQIVHKLPEINEYALIVADYFNMDKDTAEELSSKANLCAVDEGGSFTEYCDYLLDVLPSYKIERESNLFDPSFIEKPKNIKKTKPKEFKKILISLGGEDPANLSELAGKYFSGNGRDVSIVTSKNPIENLKDELYNYDLVVTHYGFTAFEAIAAGCAVILLATSKLHENLSKKYGFVCLDKKTLEKGNCEKILEKADLLFPVFEKESFKNNSYSQKIKELSHGIRYKCPICQRYSFTDSVIARTNERTFRRCKDCGMIYISWNNTLPMKYEKEYFAEQYKAQYGKTYIEDFDSIKKTCKSRVQEIKNALGFKSTGAKILDIGCAYGPFLSAASDKGFLPYGTDIAQDAVDYVRTKLFFPAVVSSFPNFDSASEFGINKFDAITMWFVIEHFSDLQSVLKKVYTTLKDGGIFAFSTPSVEGVSGKLNKKVFYEQSPSDHFSIWEPSRTKKILKEFGFEVIKIISTGHHPERFPKLKELNSKKDDFIWTVYKIYSQALRMGDTFEVYCKKIKR